MSASYAELVRRFVAVSECGSIQGAARRLNLSQPSMTQSVKRVEEIFGCRLFERTKRGVVLTLMGECLYRRSRRMLEELTLARSEIDDLSAGRRTTLRISAGTAWGYCYLPAMIRELQAQYRELKIELDISLTSDALPQLRAGEIDTFLGADDPDFSEGDGFARLPLIPLDYAAACGPASPLAERRIVSSRDFAEVPVIVYQDDMNLMNQVIARIERRIGQSLEIAVRTRSLLATLELVRTGPYAVFLAEPFLRKYSGNDIGILTLDEPLYRFPTAIFYRESLIQSRPFRTLLSLLKEHRCRPD